MATTTVEGTRGDDGSDLQCCFTTSCCTLRQWSGTARNFDVEWVSVYECTTDNDVIDLLAGGQGVFGIAVGATLTELAATITAFPAETSTAGVPAAYPGDELAGRRAKRTA